MNTDQIAPGTPLAEGRLSQNLLVLKRLRKDSGQWVPMPALVEASGSYVVHSRISDLRKAGYPIEQRNERSGRQIHSSYRLNEQPIEPHTNN
jgi:biotin operon repressor